MTYALKYVIIFKANFEVDEVGCMETIVASTKRRITTEMIERLYQLSKDVYNGNISKEDALGSISNEFDINTNSATDYINNFKYLVEGKKYCRTLSAKGTKLYLENIKNDFSNEIFNNALLAVQLHIDYYSALGYGRLRKI